MSKLSIIKRISFLIKNLQRTSIWQDVFVTINFSAYIHVYLEEEIFGVEFSYI